MTVAERHCSSSWVYMNKPHYKLLTHLSSRDDCAASAWVCWELPWAKGIKQPLFILKWTKNKTVSSGGGSKFYKSYCERNEGEKEAAPGILKV